jgi:hypothetical protein
MKTFLLKLALFFALVAAIDVCWGWGFDALRSKAHGGQTFKNEYLYRICADDILILGSSKADHHYVPSIFEDSLGISCYNAGEMGCGIIPAYTRYKMVSKRHKPKIVIYELTPGYDYLQDEGYSPYLGVIRPYANMSTVKDTYLDFSDELEGVRLISSMYRNNSKLVANVKDILTSPDKYKGYEPLYGALSPNTKQVMIADSIIEVSKVDSLKLSYMVQLINDTKLDGVQLFFAISPAYGVLENKFNSEYAPAFELCEKYDVPLMDYSKCSAYTGKNELFQDKTHLNHKGAVLYTQMMTRKINEFINIIDE